MKLTYRNQATAILGAVAAGLMVLSTNLPAGAAEAPQDPLAALSTVAPEVLADSTQASGTLTEVSGLTVASLDGASVSVSPVTSAEPVLVANGSVLQYETDEAYGFALTGGDAASAGFVTINDASAPTGYEFALTVDGQPADLVIAEAGSVEVKNAAGEIVNVILPAWARDANGHAVPTSYSVDGGVLIQTVEHAGAAYPVVADPSLACDALFCTITMNRAETQTIASNSALSVATIAAACGSFAWACGIGTAAVVDQANQAVSQNRCVGMRKAHVSPVAFPVVVKCP